MHRKPPLAVSPRRLRPRRPPTSLPSLQTPTVKARSKPPAQFPTRHSIAGEPLIGKDYPIISPELIELTKKAKDDFTAGHDPIVCTKPLFERGRFYELYSARRNERLKRKMMEISVENVAQYHEAKKRSLNKEETPRKSCPGSFSVNRASSLRSSSLRSTNKEMKKVSVSGISSMASVDVGKKMITRSALKKMI